jgi:hypothetical protein
MQFKHAVPSHRPDGVSTCLRSLDTISTTTTTTTASFDMTLSASTATVFTDTVPAVSDTAAAVYTAVATAGLRPLQSLHLVVTVTSTTV